MGLLEFQDKFPTEQICLDYLIKMRWPEGVKCLQCADSKFDYIRTRRAFECRGCRKQIYVTANTIFHKSRVPLRKWFWAIFLMATSKKGISMLYLQKQLGIKTYRTAWLMGHKIRQAKHRRKDTNMTVRFPCKNRSILTNISNGSTPLHPT